MSGFRLFDLNPEQETAVRTTEGPLLILAGAGTGKTRVITMRIAYLISHGVDPASILAVTFTNKAANEMRERLAGMIEKEKVKKVTVSTFHALCVRILRAGIERLGYKDNFSIYDESDQMGLIKKIITRTAAKDETLEPNVAKNLISKAKNNGWSAPRDGEQTLIGAVFARYQAELKTLNAVDFDDLLLLSVKLLAEHEEVRRKWQQRFKYVMVDEFQDTNRLQLELVTFIAKRDVDSPKEGEAPRTPERPNICVVGDDDQSIYGWRGAEVSNILEFEAHFPGPSVVKLEQNYRSTNSILGTANSLIKNNPRRRPKALWSSRDGGDKVRIIQMPDDRQEAQFVAEEIQRRQANDGAVWEDFAVLFRMNAQSRLIETNLRELHIPYRLIGGKSFFDRREIKDLLAYASCILNTDDDVSLLRIINTPARGISPATVERATTISAQLKCSVFEALGSPELKAELTARAAASVEAFRDLIDRYESKLCEPLANQTEVIRALIAEIGFYDDLRRSCKTEDDALKRESNVHEMIGSMEEHQGRSTEGLRGFLDELMLRQDREDDDDDKKGSGVTLITLHAAKGLEFPNVYLIGLEEGILPHDRSKVEGNLDEERRLLYVGITRAMKTLALTWCLNRLRYGSAAPCTPSSFIKELSPDHTVHQNLTQMLNTPVEETSARAGFGSIFAALNRIA